MIVKLSGVICFKYAYAWNDFWKEEKYNVI